MTGGLTIKKVKLTSKASVVLRKCWRNVFRHGNIFKQPDGKESESESDTDGDGIPDDLGDKDGDGILDSLDVDEDNKDIPGDQETEVGFDDDHDSSKGFGCALYGIND